MAYDLAIIINDQIIFCSREAQYSKFEIAIFANNLIKQLAENRSWCLHKLLMMNQDRSTSEKLLIKSYISLNKDTELLVGIIGELKQGSAYAYNLMDSFYYKINQEFPIDTIAAQIKDDKESFLSLCNLMAASLFGDQYESIVDSVSEHEKFIGDNQIIYAGISSDGLPIVSKLYENQELLHFDDPQKQSLVTTILSGQLATISINALIRAQVYMDSIQIKLNPDENRFLFFNFGTFGFHNNFTFVTLTVGNPYDLEPYFDVIRNRLNAVDIFDEPFSGALKLYAPIKEFFDQLQNKW